MSNCSKLSALTILDCQALASIPKDFGECTSIKELTLQSSRPVRTEFAMSKDWQLEVLMVSMEDVDKLVADIGNCSQLKRLAIEKSSISKLP